MDTSTCRFLSLLLSSPSCLSSELLNSVCLESMLSRVLACAVYSSHHASVFRELLSRMDLDSQLDLQSILYTLEVRASTAHHNDSKSEQHSEASSEYLSFQIVGEILCICQINALATKNGPAHDDSVYAKQMIDSLKHCSAKYDHISSRSDNHNSSQKPSSDSSHKKTTSQIPESEPVWLSNRVESQIQDLDQTRAHHEFSQLSIGQSNCNSINDTNNYGRLHGLQTVKGHTTQIHTRVDSSLCFAESEIKPQSTSPVIF